MSVFSFVCLFFNDQTFLVHTPTLKASNLVLGLIASLLSALLSYRMKTVIEDMEGPSFLRAGA